jgi:hypothetical protein
MNYIITEIGKIYFRPSMIDVDGTTLEEGTTLYDEDKNFLDDVVGLFINDEILDKENIPEPYEYEDWYLQQLRVVRALGYEY